MVLLEILDLDIDVMQRSVKNMKLVAKRQADRAKATQAQLKIRKAQHALARSRQAAAAITP